MLPLAIDRLFNDVVADTPFMLLLSIPVTAAKFNVLEFTRVEVDTTPFTLEVAMLPPVVNEFVVPFASRLEILPMLAVVIVALASIEFVVVAFVATRFVVVRFVKKAETAESIDEKKFEDVAFVKVALPA